MNLYNVVSGISYSHGDESYIEILSADILVLIHSL